MKPTLYSEAEKLVLDNPNGYIFRVYLDDQKRWVDSTIFLEPKEILDRVKATRELGYPRITTYAVRQVDGEMHMVTVSLAYLSAKIHGD